VSRRAASWLAWSLAGLCLVMAVASIVLSTLSRPAREGVGGWSTVSDLLIFVSFLAFPIVGALIASRRPGNPIGWICLVAGLFWMLIIVSESYSDYGLAVPGSVPFPVTINALLYAWTWVPTVGLMGIYLTLLFPDGKLPSGRWRPLAWFSALVILSESVIVFVTPGPLEGMEGARNPFGLESYPWLEIMGWIILLLIPVCMVASALSLVLRFRRSGGEVRQQIKWLAFAASFMGSTYLLIISAGFINWLVSVPGAQIDLGTKTWWGAILEDVMLLSFATIPLSIGFAILRYRLYDIDVIINRTLVYGSLTVTLVMVYLGSVVLLQRTFVFLTSEGSQITIVVSTLAIAALFNPMRRRIQALVDRRFYRRKYDAARTLEEFGARLRDATDLRDLGDGLTTVIRETVQPEHVSIWMAPARGKEDDD